MSCRSRQALHQPLAWRPRSRSPAAVLATEPRPPGARPLTGHRPYLRVRAGDYRVIYAVDDSARVVTIAAVGHRREIYRALDL
jgi:mRNA interferase RelE/StbE